MTDTPAGRERRSGLINIVLGAILLLAGITLVAAGGSTVFGIIFAAIGLVLLAGGIAQRRTAKQT